MRYLITGGAGFIGSHVVEELLRESHEVIVLDNLSTGRKRNLPLDPRVTFVNTDIVSCTRSELQRFATDVDAVAHLAAYASVVSSWTDPVAAHHANLTATVRVIELVRTTRIPRLVVASSAAVYGAPQHLPISEKQPPAPTSPYGLQKFTTEMYGNLFAMESSFQLVNLRLFNVFGPRQHPTSPYSGVVSKFLNAMASGAPVNVAGDGGQSRDFVFVRDVARAFVAALTSPLPAEPSFTANIGTGDAVSINELCRACEDYFPLWRRTICHVALPPGDIPHSQADCSLAERLLGFRAEYTLRSGLGAMLACTDRKSRISDSEAAETDKV